MTQDCSRIKFVCAFFFFPLSSYLARLGIRYDFTSITNTYYSQKFNSVPPDQKAVILPHCLIGDKCQARFSKDSGILCVKCKNCRCGEIRALSEERGWQFYISPSSGFTRRLVQRKPIKAAAGAACNLEIERGIRSTKLSPRGVLLKKAKVIPQLVLTTSYNCLNNDTDWDLLMRIIRQEMAEK